MTNDKIASAEEVSAAIEQQSKKPKGIENVTVSQSSWQLSKVDH